MDSEQDVNFRLRLAEGFLQEAEEDLILSRWRSCVDNTQLSVENVVRLCRPGTEKDKVNVHYNSPSILAISR